MKKADILAALELAGVAADESNTVAELKQIAADNSVDLEGASDAEEEPTADDPDILSISAHAKLSDAEKEAFRRRNGTVSNQP